MNCSDKQDNPSETEFYTDLSNLLESNNLNSVKRKTPGGNTYIVTGENGDKGVYIAADVEPFNDHLNEIKVSSETFYCNDIKMEGIYIGTNRPDESSRKILYSIASNLIKHVDESNGEIDLEKWFNEWKNTTGNTVSKKKVYDVLGEMLVLTILQERGINPIWLGPRGGSHDISCSDRDFEVKSTIKRDLIPQVTISSARQLDPTPGKELSLVLCTFEDDPNGDYSISSLSQRLIDAGYPSDELWTLLDAMDLLTTPHQRKSYKLIDDVRCYSVDDSFPRLTKDSFIDHRFPDHISNINYTVILNDVEYRKL